jgi:hypothetical protein
MSEATMDRDGVEGSASTPTLRDLPGESPPRDALTECIEMPDGTWVIADGRQFWLQRPGPFDVGLFSRHLLAPGSAHHVRQLLAGALLASLRSVRPTGSSAPARTPSLEGYIHRLAGTYQTTHATPDTMRYVASRLRAAGDADMADYCAHVADAEAGHDRLALKDLDALGICAAEFVRDVRPARSVALVSLFKRYAEGDRPIAVLGYAYVLERTALFKTKAMVDAIEAIVPPGIFATRCLRVHSAVGTDARHVTQSVEVISRLREDDRASIARAVWETAASMGLPSDYPGDAAFRQLLDRYRK